TLRFPLRQLLDSGEIPSSHHNMQAWRAWTREHPDRVQSNLEYDDSYVFFTWTTAPMGVIGRPVTPGRSIACDRRLMPQGALAFISTTKPVPLSMASNGSAAIANSADEFALAPLHRFVL